MPEVESHVEIDNETQLNLLEFFPYRLSVMYDEVSQCVAQVYTQRFQLTRLQWRVLATLGENKILSAKQIGEQTRMGKMPVSRAVTQLENNGLLKREVDPADKRLQQLSLTITGRQTYKKIVPLVKAREAFILSALNEVERRQLDSTMDKILERSRELQTYG